MPGVRLVGLVEGRLAQPAAELVLRVRRRLVLQHGLAHGEAGLAHRAEVQETVLLGRVLVAELESSRGWGNTYVEGRARSDRGRKKNAFGCR